MKESPEGPAGDSADDPEQCHCGVPPADNGYSQANDDPDGAHDVELELDLTGLVFQ